MSAILIEAVFAAGTCIGVGIGWWAARITAEVEDTKVLLSAVELIESLERK